MAMKSPPHSGDFIRTRSSPLTVTAVAGALHVSQPALSSLLNGKAYLSGDVALRIEKAFGVKMDTLVRIQSSYDIPGHASAKSKSMFGEFTRRPTLTSEALREFAHLTPRKATVANLKGRATLVVSTLCWPHSLIVLLREPHTANGIRCCTLLTSVKARAHEQRQPVF